MLQFLLQCWLSIWISVEFTEQIGKDSTKNIYLQRHLNTNNTENFIMQKLQSCTHPSSFSAPLPQKQLLLIISLLSSSGGCLYNAINHVTVITVWHTDFRNYFKNCLLLLYECKFSHLPISLSNLLLICVFCYSPFLTSTSNHII